MIESDTVLKPVLCDGTDPLFPFVSGSRPRKLQDSGLVTSKLSVFAPGKGRGIIGSTRRGWARAN